MLAATIVDQRIVMAQRPDPVAGAGELLVRVRAAGLNGADIAQLAGRYPAPPGSPADIPGLEFAGEVVAAGGGVSRFATGDRVMAVVGGGAMAELCTVHERVAMPVPVGLAWEAAGAFPEAFTTAHDALFTQAGLGPGERVCIHGAAGGVGTAAVQLALAAGASVVATVRDPAARTRVGELHGTGTATRLRAVAPAAFPEHGPYDVILELVGAPNMEENLGALATGGRICVIGVGAGAQVEINLLSLMRSRGRIHGSTLRARPLEEKAIAARLIERHVLPDLALGRLRVPVGSTFGLAATAGAFERFVAGGKFGKVVVLP